MRERKRRMKEGGELSGEKRGKGRDLGRRAEDSRVCPLPGTMAKHNWLLHGFTKPAKLLTVAANILSQEIQSTLQGKHQVMGHLAPGMYHAVEAGRTARAQQGWEQPCHTTL